MWKSAMEAINLVAAAPTAPQVPPSSKYPARLYQDDIENIRRAPMSDKGRISREKLKSAVARDEESWKELQSRMRGTKLCTHAGLMMVLNQSILLDVGANTVKREVNKPQMRIGFEEKEQINPVPMSPKYKTGKNPVYERDERSEEIVATIKQMLQSTVGGLGTTWRDTNRTDDNYSVCSDSHMRRTTQKKSMSRRGAFEKSGSSQSLSPPREDTRRRQVTSLSPRRDIKTTEAVARPHKVTNKAFLALPLSPQRKDKGIVSLSPKQRSDVSDSDSDASLLLEEFPVRENMTTRRTEYGRPVLQASKKASILDMPQLSFCNEESSDEESDDDTDFLEFFPSLKNKEQPQSRKNRRGRMEAGTSGSSSVQLSSCKPLPKSRRKRATSLPSKAKDSPMSSGDKLNYAESKAENVRTFQTLNAALALTSQSKDVNRPRAA